MTKNKKNITQRTYSLRLNGADPNDDEWRKNLWQTHRTVNLGAKIFGDFLLTFCGGISHELAEPDKDQKLSGTLKERRIILALSWISVEDKSGAPDEKYHIKPESAEDALRNILKKRGLEQAEIDNWCNDCRNTINAKIPNNTIRINRADIFDDLEKDWNISLADAVWDFFACDICTKKFITQQQYLQPTTTKNKPEKNRDMLQAAASWLAKRFTKTTDTNLETISNNLNRLFEWCNKKQDKLIKLSGNDFAKKIEKANLSLNFSKYAKKVTAAIESLKVAESISRDDIGKLLTFTKDAFEKTIKKSGNKTTQLYAQKIKEKIETETGFLFSQKKISNAKNKKQKDKTETYRDTGRQLFTVMLDHAARKFTSRLAMMKLTEACRVEILKSLDVLAKVPESAAMILDEYFLGREELPSANLTSVNLTSANLANVIRADAAAGWDEVLQSWTKCNNRQERINVVQELQKKKDGVEKFGDVNLFIELSDEKYGAVWKDNNPAYLKNYLIVKKAECRVERLKIPAYCHPDPLLFPVYCDFGESRLSVDFRVNRDFVKLCEPRVADDFSAANVCDDVIDRVMLEVVGTSGGSLQKSEFVWQGKRFVRDVGVNLFYDLRGGKITDKITISDSIPRRDRFGLCEFLGDKPKVAATFANEGRRSRPKWNCRLQIDRNELNKIAELAGGNADHFDVSTWSKKAQLELTHVKWFASLSTKLYYPDVWKRYKNSVENVDGKILPQYGKGENIASGNGRLCHLSGLRVLSVDLGDGSRYGAACAVWEVVSREQMIDEAEKSGWSKQMVEDYLKEAGKDVYFKLERDSAKRTKRGDDVVVSENVVFRRIADDSVKDACWAKLVRQFTIKLQGERDYDKRKPIKYEQKHAAAFLRGIGLELTIRQRGEMSRIGSLLRLLVEAMRLRIVRHNNLVRAANALRA
ncbi:MAG: type V CRISPR-associated protein Cas12b, partial [Planctomycetaceae bacterium]|nr:type V CRISPR-associated protein Cas12b [Planctomycetaceae bacterium]